MGRLDTLYAQKLRIAHSDAPYILTVDFRQQPIQFVFGEPGQRDDVPVLRVMFGDLVSNNTAAIIAENDTGS